MKDKHFANIADDLINLEINLEIIGSGVVASRVSLHLIMIVGIRFAGAKKWLLMKICHDAKRILSEWGSCASRSAAADR